MCNATHMNEACHTYEWGMSHISVRNTHRNITRIDESRDTNECVMWRIWMRHVIQSFGVCVRPVYQQTRHSLSDVCMCLVECVSDLCMNRPYDTYQHMCVRPVCVRPLYEQTFTAPSLSVMSRMSMNHVTHNLESCHIWIRHLTRINEWCHTYERVKWYSISIGVGAVMSHMCKSCHSYHTYQRVVSHIWMSHVTHMNESCHTYEWVMSHEGMSHVTRRNESCHTYE